MSVPNPPVYGDPAFISLIASSTVEEISDLLEQAWGDGFTWGFTIGRTTDKTQYIGTDPRTGEDV